MPAPLSKLYAIVDVDACERRSLALGDVARAVCAARPALLQLRAKDRPAAQVLSWLRLLRPLTTEARCLLYCNDRADLAALSGCDGVHVGQDDLPLESLRRHFPQLKVGISTHNAVELRAALAQRPDYVALGPIFPTSSKQRPSAVVGLDVLAALGAEARAAGTSLVAIGGIEGANCQAVLRHADLVASISALLPEALPPDGDLDASVLGRCRALGA